MHTVTAFFGTAALLVVLAGCGEDTSVPPPAPPEPAAEAPAATPAVNLTEPLRATPGAPVHAFQVPSIHCTGCAETIRMTVEKLDGVQAVSVSVPEHTVWVQVTELGPTADTLAQTITDAGYEATPQG